MSIVLKALAISEIDTLSLHDALPIYWIDRFYYCSQGEAVQAALPSGLNFISEKRLAVNKAREGEVDSAGRELLDEVKRGDRKSTRLNSSHVAISYAVFCLKKKKTIIA